MKPERPMTNLYRLLSEGWFTGPLRSADIELPRRPMQAKPARSCRTQPGSADNGVTTRSGLRSLARRPQ
jgi:hypothetical protein